VEKARRALQALARVVHSAPVTRRVVLAPLCDAVVERAANMAGSGETHSLAFAALADALAGVDGGVSVLLPLNTKTGLRTPGILQTAAMTADSVSSDTSLRAALLAAALLHAPGRDANAFACSETVADAACHLTRAAVAACDAVAQGPLLLEAERVVMRRHAEAIDTRQGGTSSDTRLDATYTPLNDASMDASLTTDGCSANDAAFRVATATFEGARPDVSYPLDTAAGVAVTSALAFLATLSDTQTTPKSQLAASHALCSLVHKRGASGTLGGNGGLDAAIGGGVATVGSLGLFDHSGPNAAGGVLRALAQRGDPSSRVFAKTLVALLSHENRLVAANAARALGEAMRSGGGGAGAMRVYHGVEKPLFRQKFFAQTLPDVLAVLQIPNRNAVLGGTNSNSSGIQGNTNSSGIQDNTSNDSGNKQSVRPAALSAVVHLSRHAPGSAAFAAGLKILPLLPEAARVLSDVTSPFHDADALAAAVVLIAGFFADPRGRNALETHADANAGAMLRALCELAASRDDADDAETQNKKETQTQTQKRETTACLEVRETSLEALVAATSLPFSCVYPYRKEVTAAATMALDDPKRRVRRAAARCREVWLALDTKT
jgi:DNA repair/transcription protein MET18/MMS19